MNENYSSSVPRPVTPMASQSVDPQLLQQMLVALTNLQLQISGRKEASSRDPKVPDVQTFNGNKSQYSVFLARLQNFFSLQPKTYDTDTKKIGYVISRLEGSAADWAVTVLENPTLNDNSQILNCWNSFLLAFSKFSDPFSKRNATDMLLSLAQGKNQSVLSYWTKFSELLYRSDISPDSARPLFERGLRYEIRDRLVDKDLPMELDSYVLAVIDLDNRLYRLKQERKNDNGRFQDVARYASHFSTQSGNGVVPMDIGALQTNLNSMDSKDRLEEIRRMEPEQRRKVCFDEHRCHYCKRVVGSPPSHVAQNCPAKTNKTKSEYLDLKPEVHPQKGIPDSYRIEGVPQRQVFSLSHPEKNFRKNVLLHAAGNMIEAQALIDSGAMGVAYIDHEFARQHQLSFLPVESPIEIKTVDGNPCGKGTITDKVLATLEIEGQKQELEFHVISSPSISIILGWSWLKLANPVIDWKKETLSFCEGTPDSKDGVPQRQVFIDLIDINGLGSDIKNLQSWSKY